jgi:hypothetical protein
MEKELKSLGKNVEIHIYPRSIARVRSTVRGDARPPKMRVLEPASLNDRQGDNVGCFIRQKVVATDDRNSFLTRGGRVGMVRVFEVQADRGER